MLVVVLVLSLVKDSFMLNINGSNVCLTNVTNSENVTVIIAECCPDYIEQNNTCQECPAGTYGGSCKDKCVGNKYGPRCKLDCNCGPRQHCDVAEGCICEDGYTGENCTEECRLGWYGDQCSRVCDCKDDETCHHRYGCIPSECPDDYYGRYCGIRCFCFTSFINRRSNSHGCHRWTGECKCGPGSKGSRCDSKCEEGRYGDQCSNVCNCTNGYTCHPASGRCNGYKYDEECPIGFRGAQCLDLCPCVHNAGCHRKTGKCICRPGWKGHDCWDECGYGWHGKDCKQLCNCPNNDTCHHVTGTCYDYSSINGTKECSADKYGKNCDKRCFCRNEGRCHRFSGQCICKPGFLDDICYSACKLGYYGQNCFHICNCGGNEVCDHVSGCLERDSCGGNITAGNGTLTSPNFPNSYKPDTLCEWRITTEMGYLVGLKFHAFNLQRAWQCTSNDYLEIRDGDANAQIMGSYCGERVLDDILSTSNKLYIKFKSDFSYQKTGFNASFAKVFDYCASDDHGCDHICNGTYGNYTCECRSGYQLQRDQKKCEECVKGYYGIECQQNCTCDNYVSCHPSSGQCLCLPGWEGENCNRKCEYGRYGENCSYACECRNRVCDHISGVCYDFKEEATWSASVILFPAVAVLLLIIISISVITILKCRKRRHIYTTKHPVNNSETGYDDIDPYDDIAEEQISDELSALRGQELHYLRIQEESTEPLINVANNTHPIRQRENLTRPLPNPNGASCSDDDNTNPDLTFTAVGNDYIEPYSTIFDRYIKQNESIKLLSQAQHADRNDYLEPNSTTPKSIVEQIAGIDHMSQEQEAKRHDYLEHNSTTPKSTTEQPECIDHLFQEAEADRRDYLILNSTSPKITAELTEGTDHLSPEQEADSHDYLELNSTKPKSADEQMEGINLLSQEPEAERHDYLELNSTTPKPTGERKEAINNLSQEQEADRHDYLEHNLTTPKTTAKQMEDIDHLFREAEADRHDYLELNSTSSKSIEEQAEGIELPYKEQEADRHDYIDAYSPTCTGTTD